MKKAVLFFLLIIWMPWDSFSQVDSILAGALQGYIVPLPWIDRNPRLRLGMEYHAKNHLGYSMEIGIGNSHLNHSRLEKLNWGKAYSFFEVRPEMKWYRKVASSFETYFAAEVFYYHMTDQLEKGSYYPDKHADEVLFDAADFRKDKTGLQVKMGMKILILKRFVLDFYEGVGLAYRNIQYTNVVNPVIPEYETTEEWWGESYKNAGEYLLLQFSFGVRAGYVFGKL